MDTSPDFDFRHHLYDTLILLGAKKEIADLLKKSKDGQVTDEDVHLLRCYNGELLIATKTRLTEINTISIRPTSSHTP